MFRLLKLVFFSAVAAVITLALYLYFYLGSYKPVGITVEDRGPLHLLYKEHTGAYHEIGPAIHEVESWARSQNIPCTLTYGEYLDNPETKDQDRLRSRGGCMLEGPLPIATNPYTYEVRPRHSYMIAVFQGSPAIGPFKVYPAVKKALKEQHLIAKEAVIETYLVNGDNVTTQYLFTLEKP